MQINRHHSHTRRTAYLYGIGSLALLAAVLVLSFINRYAASIPLLLLCYFGFQVLKDVILPRAERWATGHLGEKRVLGVLRDLPDTYTAVTNFVVPGSERGDIDLIVVGPMGILAVEIKTYAGVIVYENGRWWRRQSNGWKTKIKKSLSGQAKGHRTTLIAFLKDRRDQHPVLCDLFVPITPVLVFVGADQLETTALDMAAIRAGDLMEYILSLPSRHTDAQVAALTELFKPDEDRTATKSRAR